MAPHQKKLRPSGYVDNADDCDDNDYDINPAASEDAMESTTIVMGQATIQRMPMRCGVL